jgi:hypothetical protein
MNIPLLSRARLGYSFLDIDTSRQIGKIPFSENRMVLGVGTQAFTLADSVGFGLKTALPIPLIIRSDKTICLSSSGSNLNSNEICTEFGQYIDTTHQTERICGVNYVILGRGDYQVPDPATCAGAPATYIPRAANSANNIVFFRGNERYTVYPARLGQTTLNSAFFGQRIGNDGDLILSNGSVTLSPTTAIPLVFLGVRVSDARISSTAGTVNRGVERYVESGNLLNAFLAGIKSNTTNTATTTTTSTRPTATITVTTNPQGIGSKVA